MEFIRFTLIIIFRPLVSYFKTLYQLLVLKLYHPTLKLSGTASTHSTIFGKYNYISADTVVHHSVLGDFSYVGANSYINRVIIGKFTCIGPGVKMGLGEHPTENFMSIHPIFYSPRNTVGITFSDKYYFNEFSETVVGNDVWIGADVIIKSGIKIGDGAIVASGAFVSRDIPPYTIVGGVPARSIKMRFTEEQITKLLRIQWWNQDINWLRKNYQMFHSLDNIDDLAELIEQQHKR